MTPATEGCKDPVPQKREWWHSHPHVPSPAAAELPRTEHMCPRGTEQPQPRAGAGSPAASGQVVLVPGRGAELERAGLAVAPVPRQ